MTKLTNPETASALDVLVAARALIADPARWGQGEYALDAHDQEISPIDPKACKFCALGATYHVADQNPYELEGRWCAGMLAATSFLSRAASGKGFMGAVANINDKGTHADVLALFDKAIELAKGTV